MKLWKSCIVNEDCMVWKLFQTIWRVEKLTVEMALPEDGADEYQNKSEC